MPARARLVAAAIQVIADTKPLLAIDDSDVDFILSVELYGDNLDKSAGNHPDLLPKAPNRPDAAPSEIIRRRIDAGDIGSKAVAAALDAKDGDSIDTKAPAPVADELELDRGPDPKPVEDIIDTSAPVPAADAPNVPAGADAPDYTRLTVKE